MGTQSRWRGRLSGGRAVLSAVVREVRAENVTFLAGSIAYHAFVSLLPFLLLMLFVLSRVGDPELARRLLTAMAGYLGPDEIGRIVEVATRATENAQLSLVSLLVLVWGVFRVFRGLDTAFSEIYESERHNTFLDQLVDAAVVFLAVGAGITLVSLTERLFGFPSFGAAGVVVRPAAAVLAVTVALLPMFYVFPDERVTVREVVPGALVAGVGWVALGSVFRFYADLSSSSEYGVVGVVILLVTWLYFTGLLLLVGASVNAVLAGRSEDVGDIAWGDLTDPADNDAPFVAPLRALEDAFAPGTEEPVTVERGETRVTLPAPDEARVTVSTVERPRLLGGSRESGTVLLRWDSREAGEDTDRDRTGRR